MLDQFTQLSDQNQPDFPHIPGICGREEPPAETKPAADFEGQQNEALNHQPDHNEPAGPKPRNAAKRPGKEATAGNAKRGPLDEGKFASAKLSFGLAVGLDTKLPKLAYQLALILIGKYMNADKGGDAFAAISTYCADLGLSPKSGSAVRMALAALVDHGHLRAARAKGGVTRFSIPDKYFSDGQPRHATWQGQEATPPRHVADSNPTKAPTPPRHVAGGPPRHVATNTVQITPHKESDSRAPQFEFDQPVAPKEESRASPPTRRAPKKAAEAAEAAERFERFWSAYPRPESKPAARKAWSAAIKSGADAGAIIEGARRYAAECEAEGRERRYTKMPATYLNNRCWEDPPPPPRAASNGEVDAMCRAHANGARNIFDGEIYADQREAFGGRHG